MGEPPCWRWFLPVEGRYLNSIIVKLSNEFLFKDGDEYEYEYEYEDKKEK